MNVALDQTVTFDFLLHNPFTGAVSDADALPACAVFEDTTDVPILAPVPAKRAALVGDYRVSFVTSLANGFEEGKSYNVVASATVAGVPAKARVGAFIVQSGSVAAPGTSL